VGLALVPVQIGGEERSEVEISIITT
jgi:hypothetical protein